jgi:ABC-2 type transport system ATP-binding protein
VSAVLELSGLTKKYGRITAVNNLSFSVERGCIFGILGPNGSGKTTTLGMLLGVTQPLSGSFSWFNGEKLQDAKKRIGTLLETPNFYPYMTARQNLVLVAKIKGVKNPNIIEVLEQVKLLDRADDKFKTFSLGMKQRLAIAGALLGKPELLVLDEPTNGLDPRGIAEVRQLILDIAERGISVIMASHILAEVERVCSHVIVLNKGILKFAGLASELSGQTTRLSIGAKDMEGLAQALEAYPKVQKFHPITEGRFEMILNEDTDPSELNKYMLEKGIYLNHLNSQKSSLEEGFLKLIES